MLSKFRICKAFSPTALGTVLGHRVLVREEVKAKTNVFLVVNVLTVLRARVLDFAVVLAGTPRVTCERNLLMLFWVPRLSMPVAEVPISKHSQDFALNLKLPVDSRQRQHRPSVAYGRVRPVLRPGVGACSVLFNLDRHPPLKIRQVLSKQRRPCRSKSVSSSGPQLSADHVFHSPGS